MKTTIYCRVSTEDQENEGTILQTQLALPIARARTERAAEVEYQAVSWRGLLN